MTEEEKTAFIAGLAVGVSFTLILAFGVAALNERFWRSAAIEHGAARYSATSGSFEWIEVEK